MNNSNKPCHFGVYAIHNMRLTRSILVVSLTMLILLVRVIGDELPSPYDEVEAAATKAVDRIIKRLVGRILKPE